VRIVQALCFARSFSGGWIKTLNGAGSSMDPRPSSAASANPPFKKVRGGAVARWPP